jgi:hypothetical protein
MDATLIPDFLRKAYAAVLPNWSEMHSCLVGVRRWVRMHEQFPSYMFRPVVAIFSAENIDFGQLPNRSCWQP